MSNFDEAFFQWLSNNLQKRSNSGVHEEIKLDRMSDDFFAPV